MIADRREKMAAGREVPEDMLQFMMKEKEEGGSVMDDDQIVDEIITFMIAGKIQVVDPVLLPSQPSQYLKRTFERRAVPGLTSSSVPPLCRA